MDQTLKDLEKELYKINPQADDPMVWVTRDNRKIMISDLDDGHLFNILRMIKKRVYISLRRQILGKVMYILSKPDEINELCNEAMLSWRDYIPVTWKERVANLEKEINSRGITHWESRRPHDLRKNN